MQMTEQPDRQYDRRGPHARQRTLAIDVDDIDESLAIDQKVAALWRSARLGPTVERLRRHVLRNGSRSIEAGQFRALDAVAAHGPVSVRDLAVIMDLEPSTVTRATTKLESADLVRKSRASHDHRQVLIELTDEGAELHGYFVDRAYEIYEEIFAVFSDDERALLADYLERMLKATDVALARVEP